MKRTLTWLVFLALLFGLLAQQQTAFAIGQGDLIKANDGFEVGKTVFFGEFKQNSKNSPRASHGRSAACWCPSRE